ncbi:MAG: MraY family glycosyltransferase [Myxococcota bacterium]
MRSLLAAFVISNVVTAVLIPFVRRFALRRGAVANGGGRHVHDTSVPRLGGIAICVGILVPVVGLFLVDSGTTVSFEAAPGLALGLFVGSVTMCVLGAVDDTRGIRALYKLYAQLGVASFAFACGFRIEAVDLPLFGSVSMGIFALPVTVAWIVGITNAVNLIDGLDGLAGGVVFFAALTNLVVSVIGHQVWTALVMAATLGAVLGFLYFNFNPARIFMGDSGSYLLGYVLAVTALAGVAVKASTAVALLVPIVALGVPIIDTLFAILRRYLERRPLFSPDRGHIHHRLLDLGLTHRRAVLLLYAVSVIFTVASIAIYLGRAWQVGVALLVCSITVFGLARFVVTSRNSTSSGGSTRGSVPATPNCCAANCPPPWSGSRRSARRRSSTWS